MANDDDGADVLPDLIPEAGEHPCFSDATAERAYAFGLLASRLDAIGDETIRKVGIEMLGVLSRSIALPPPSSVRALKG